MSTTEKSKSSGRFDTFDPLHSNISESCCPTKKTHDQVIICLPVGQQLSEILLWVKCISFATTSGPDIDCGSVLKIYSGWKPWFWLWDVFGRSILTMSPQRRIHLCQKWRVNIGAFQLSLPAIHGQDPCRHRFHRQQVGTAPVGPIHSQDKRPE